MSRNINRRELLKRSGAALGTIAGAGAIAGSASAASCQTIESMDNTVDDDSMGWIPWYYPMVEDGFDYHRIHLSSSGGSTYFEIDNGPSYDDLNELESLTLSSGESDTVVASFPALDFYIDATNAHGEVTVEQISCD